MSFLGDMASSFFPFLGSLFSGGANYYGQQQSNAANLNIARETNAANAKQVKDMMDFQERMSGTAYQRQIADMKAAGINPMLAASMGGASSPPGASVPAVTGHAMQNVLGPAVNSAIDSMRLKNEVNLMQENVKNLRETNKKIITDASLNRAMRKSAEADAVLKLNSAKVAGANARLLNNQIPGSNVEAALDQTTYGKFMRTLGRANPLTSTFTSAASGARDLSKASSFRFGNDSKSYTYRK